MNNIKEIHIKDSEYPPLLRETQNPPSGFFLKGVMPNSSLRHIAIVGTRKATLDGIDLARKLGKSLAEKGFVIVSGLAMGIDTAAHLGALDVGGKTIAVLGNGIDKIYPAQNENLAKKILEKDGAIISEYKPGSPGLPHQFLERNRIVAGLSMATIIIEAPKKSGAIVTARLAAESGREVFVFPGPAGHPQYAGSHALVRDGARLVNSIDDLLEDLAFEEDKKQYIQEELPIKNNSDIIYSENSKMHNHNQEKDKQGFFMDVQFSGKHQNVCDVLLKYKEGIFIDKIVQEIKLAAEEVNEIISELVIYGIVEETASGYKLRN